MNNQYTFGGTPAGAPDTGAVVQFYKQATAWSYSTVTNHKNCPLKRRFTWIDGLKEPESAAQANGGRVHTKMANAINTGNFEGIDAQWFPLLTQLRENAARTEQQQSFTKDWLPTEWFAKDTWVRVVFDAIYRDNDNDRVVVVDWKTGKPSNDHMQQLRLYALAGLMLYPMAKECEARMSYLDAGIDKTVIYMAGRRSIPALQQEFVEFSKEFLNDSIYPAKPGPLCGPSQKPGSTYTGCHFRKSNGGPCAYA